MNSNLVLNRVVLGMALAIGAPALALAAQPAPDGNAAEMDSEQPVTDTWITTKVKADLAVTEGVSATEISVNTTNGVVTLIGVVDSETAMKKAISVAKGIKGVKDVDSSGLKVK